MRVLIFSPPQVNLECYKITFKSKSLHLVSFTAPIKPNQTESNRIKPNQTESNRIKPNQTESNLLVSAIAFVHVFYAQFQE